ncbi:tetratricopeptide repeat protein [Myxococcus xanthus]|uniref:TonB C-terminal domain-containing protein n=1 Tax=Myxococcus xanthus TaxID=34 RepID=A0A7Y4II72_MYXXA|nr:hypothetical protein [Myxococcus xanthus]NOJ79629.1 hypothetical protein [Myxococcus xanthus]NOJ85949.1 hypothetical protein [Myxococcus xanthus]
MALYQERDQSPEKSNNVLWPGDSSESAPALELSAEDAPVAFQDAVQVLSGAPSTEQVRTAWLDLAAACRAELAEACTYLQEQVQRPKRVSGEPPKLTKSAMNARTIYVLVLRARLGTDGRIRKFTVVESAPYGMTEQFIKALAAHVYVPAKLAGHPIEYPLTFKLSATGYKEYLSQEEELRWLRARVAQFPGSGDAWLDLARFLASHASQDPDYEKALHALNRLSPEAWWPATELAWLRAQEGKYAEAAPLAKVGRRFAPENPYALETSALVAFHQGHCREAVADQQQAVAKFPEEWPEEERARFKRALEAYRRGCSSEPAPAAPLNGERPRRAWPGAQSGGGSNAVVSGRVKDVVGARRVCISCFADISC